MGGRETQKNTLDKAGHFQNVNKLYFSQNKTKIHFELCPPQYPYLPRSLGHHGSSCLSELRGLRPPDRATELYEECSPLGPEEQGDGVGNDDSGGDGSGGGGGGDGGSGNGDGGGGDGGQYNQLESSKCSSGNLLRPSLPSHDPGRYGKLGVCGRDHQEKTAGNHLDQKDLQHSGDPWPGPGLTGGRIQW